METSALLLSIEVWLVMLSVSETLELSQIEQRKA